MQWILFATCLDELSVQPHTAKEGYAVDNIVVNHLLFADDVHLVPVLEVFNIFWMHLVIVLERVKFIVSYDSDNSRYNAITATMQKSNLFSMEIWICESTTTKELISVNKDCHCITKDWWKTVEIMWSTNSIRNIFAGVRK